MSFIDPAAEQALRAAEATGSADAYYNLGLLYSTGQGVEIDLVEAHKWFNLAAMQGKAEAKAWRKELAEDMSVQEVAVAQRQAREWLAAH